MYVLGPQYLAWGCLENEIHNTKHMRYLILLLATGILIGCTQPEPSDHTPQTTVETNDEYSQKIQLLFDKYVQNDFDVMEYYAEDVACYINNAVFSGRDNLMGGFKMHHDIMYKDIAIEESTIQTEYWSNGEVWSRAWFTWTGTGQTTGDSYSNRGHFDYKWENGQIVTLMAYYSEEIQNKEAAALQAAADQE